MSEHDDFDDNELLADLRRARAERAAALGNDLHRMIAASRRRQYLQGDDIYARDPKTGQFVVVFKGTGQRAKELDESWE